jgi:hypothetical protein
MTALSILALLLIAVAMGLSLAHALEFPGKVRLDESTYRAVQTIYYPGFTIGGLVGEVGGILVLVMVVITTPVASSRFWWTLGALVLLAAVHTIYWTVTHPINSTWLKGAQLGVASRAFFRRLASPQSDWRRMRDLWEWSHVSRAVLAMLSLQSMAMAIAQGG